MRRRWGLLWGLGACSPRNVFLVLLEIGRGVAPSLLASAVPTKSREKARYLWHDVLLGLLKIG